MTAGLRARSDPLLVGSTSRGNEQKTSNWSLARAILPMSSLAIEQHVEAVRISSIWRSSSRFFARSRHAGKIEGEREHAVEPEFEPEGNRILARLQAIGDVARQMSQAGLMQRSMPLLRAISVRRPNARLMPVHGFAHDLGRAGEVGHMDDGALAAKHPMVGIDAFNAPARLVTGDKGSLAQNRERLPFLLVEGARRAGEHIHQSALADRQAEQIGECAAAHRTEPDGFSNRSPERGCAGRKAFPR